GNDSWGYNTNFMFALDKYYGTKNDYKAFVDACHQKGIAVIQDIVLEDQFGSSPMVRMYAQSSGAPSSDNPWFYTDNRHPYAVGYQLDHTSAVVQQYTKDVMKYWMKEYHIDGFRFDQSKAFTPKYSLTDAEWSAYDATRIAILKRYKTYLDSLDNGAYLILEHFANNDEQKVLTDAGMVVWTNLNYNANQATMGWNTDWDLSGLFYKGYGYTQPYNMVAYFESHDEERLQFKNGQYGNASGSYSVKDLATGLSRDGMAAAFLMASPGPKMIWQFGERGYDISIDYNGRTGAKDPHWEYMSDANRLKLYNLYAKLIKMKINNDVYNTTNYNYDLGGLIKYTLLKGTDGTNVLVVGNFDVATASASIPLPTNGTWYDNLSDNTVSISNNSTSMTLQPGEFHIYSTSKLK
ncbi:MAG: alpha-amylase, partial [Pseudopedobacter saltans]